MLALRERGLSVPAAVDRVRGADMATDRPSLFGALAGGDQPVGSQILTKRTLLAISRAIEDEAMSRAASPLVFGAFQRERNYRAVEHRYRAMARTADAVVVFADFERLGTGGAIAEVPLEAGGALGNEWAVVIDAPGYSACLLAWEQPRRRRAVPDGERTFETIWTLDPRTVRRAAEVGAALARRADDALGERVEHAAVRAPAGDGASRAEPDVGDEPDRRLSRRALTSRRGRTAPMRSVCVKPSCCAAAAVRSQRASPPNGPRSTTGTTSVRDP